MDYLSRKSLASYHVNTPDPYLNDPPLGQQILINWSLPRDYYACFDELFIKLTVRFCNHEETIKCLKLEKHRGIITYRLINEEYFAKCGIQTYKVELIGNDQVLEAWHHQLWAELIYISI